MCSKCRLHFLSRLCILTKQEIEFFPRSDIVSYFLLLLLVYDWPSVRWHLKGICCGSLYPKYQERIIVWNSSNYLFCQISVGIISCPWQLLYSTVQLLLDWFISKGADTSQQPEPTNKQTKPWCKQFMYNKGSGMATPSMFCLFWCFCSSDNSF